MIEWKQAEKLKDQAKMNSLQAEIDILKIIWAERVNY
jgi:hypothetical protein